MPQKVENPADARETILKLCCKWHKSDRVLFSYFISSRKCVPITFPKKSENAFSPNVFFTREQTLYSLNNKQLCYKYTYVMIYH